MSQYYDWVNNSHTCNACGWIGLGSEAVIGEAFDSGAEYICPECSQYFGYVSFPLIREVMEDPRANPMDRIALEIAQREIKKLN